MTIQQFLTQLKKVAKTRKFQTNNGLIRYRHLCPMEVVAGTEHGTAYGSARRKLKMSVKSVVAIMEAADYDPAWSKDIKRPRYYRALLKATGLA